MPGLIKMLKRALFRCFKIIAVAALVFILTLVFLLVLALIADLVVGGFLPAPTFAANPILPPLTDQQIQLHDFTCTVSSNSLGLRDHEVTPAKTTAYRIVAIGDSYTFGWGVDIDKTWCKCLERRLREAGLDVEVINVGKPGAGPHDYVFLADMAVSALKPDLVVLEILQGNDLFQSFNIHPDILFPSLWRLALLWPQLRHTPPDLPKTRVQVPIESHRNYYKSMAQSEFARLSPEERKRFDALDTQVKDLFFDGMLNPWMIAEGLADNTDFFTFATQPDDLERRGKLWALKILLKRIKRTAQHCGARVAVVSMPNGVYDNYLLFNLLCRFGYTMNPEILMSQEPDRAVRAAGDAAGVPVCEVTQLFRDRCNDPNLYFPTDHHFTPLGHDLLAKGITPFIMKELEAIPKQP